MTLFSKHSKHFPLTTLTTVTMAFSLFLFSNTLVKASEQPVNPLNPTEKVTPSDAAPIVQETPAQESSSPTVEKPVEKTKESAKPKKKTVEKSKSLLRKKIQIFDPASEITLNPSLKPLSSGGNTSNAANHEYTSAYIAAIAGVLLFAKD